MTTIKYIKTTSIKQLFKNTFLPNKSIQLKQHKIPKRFTKYKHHIRVEICSSIILKQMCGDTIQGTVCVASTTCKLNYGCLEKKSKKNLKKTENK